MTDQFPEGGFSFIVESSVLPLTTPSDGAS